MAFLRAESFWLQGRAAHHRRLQLDGKYKGASVLVFNHHENPGKRIDEETIQSIHASLGDKVGPRFFIIAPRRVFDFQKDYLDLGGVRPYALRIPYSVIHELHRNPFTALRQPSDENAINETVDAVGFDFIRPPQVKWKVGQKPPDQAFIKIKAFKSLARLHGEETYGGLETFSMLLLDFDLDGDVFSLDSVFYARQIEEQGWKAAFPTENLGKQVMVVFMDIHGNESIEVIPREKFTE
jgi:site-specific DNA-methyltransferase (adenine-specific)/adenine-specific DNA-methyltransferase